MLETVVGGDAAALADLLARAQSGEGWQLELVEAGNDAAVLALAEYLALNGPFEAAAGADVPTLIAGLPADGKELFVETCLSCHGVAQYYLLQDKTFDEWMAIFDAPYHRRLLTDGVERETFASYAAAAMPIDPADIPAEWQD